jgi:hypothetical protein
MDSSTLTQITKVSESVVLFALEISTHYKTETVYSESVI